MSFCCRLGVDDYCVEAEQPQHSTRAVLTRLDFGLSQTELMAYLKIITVLPARRRRRGGSAAVERCVSKNVRTGAIPLFQRTENGDFINTDVRI